MARTVDPLKFGKRFWPHVEFYREQREVIYSVAENDETFVPAANKMGKDFVAGFLVLYFFLTRHPCRVVTTSAKDDHLRVLWGEIGRFVQSAAEPLDWKKGGPLVINHHDIRKMYRGEKCSLSYLKGMVAATDSIAAMQGHHIAKTGDGIPRTLFVSDESSSVPHDYYKMARTWFNRSLVLGNTWPCDNFFKHAIKGTPDGSDPGGDILSMDGRRYYRKIIRIRAQDSPNVRLAEAQLAAGKSVTGEMLIEGVKDWEEYCKDRQLWDPIQQCVSLDAEFYEGAEIRLFPREWLDRAANIAIALTSAGRRQAKYIGIDPAEGGDKTSMVAIDELGVIELISKKTPNTAVITTEAKDFMHKHGVKPENVLFDRGGGGKQHADRLRSEGYNVRTVAFGETVVIGPRRGMTLFLDRLDTREDATIFVNRRAQMYGEMSQLLDPSMNPRGFGIPREYSALFQQLSPIPKTYDSEGRLKLLPKNKRETDSKEKTLTELIGHSPDEADALALAIHGMMNEVSRPTAGAIV